MTHQEILTQAIEKAIDGGWTDYKSLESLELISNTANTVTLEGWVEYVEEGETDEAKMQLTFNYKGLIFNHDFARALWGEQTQPYQILTQEIEPFGVEHETYYKPKWQVHLQQMVIADDPIAYLGQNI